MSAAPRRTIGPGMNLPFAASGEGPYPSSGAVGGRH